jgi:hypothetical protein
MPALESAAASLESLPDEILLLIVTEFVDDDDAPRYLCILTSICSRLRTLYANTPGLWTNIDFEAQQVPWIELSVDRSRNALVSLRLYVDDEFEDEIELKRRCLAKASHLTVFLVCDSNAVLSSFWSVFDSSIDVPRLEVLRAIGSPYVDVVFDLDRPCLVNASKLHRMTVIDATVQKLPQLPALLTLKILRTCISPECLYSLFISAPRLSDIDLISTRLIGQHAPIAPGQIYLPRLQTLQILHSSLEAVAAMFRLISNPRRSLILCAMNAEWTSSDNTYIVERMQQFWVSVQPFAPQIPPVAVLCAGSQSAGQVAIEITAPMEQIDSLELYYECKCTGMGPGALMDTMSIKTAQINCWSDQRLPTDSLEWFDDVETLLIRDLSYRPCTWDQCTDMLEAYVRRRRDQGRALKSFFFRFGDEAPGTTWNMRRLHDRLAAEYGSESVTWTPRR